MSGIVSKNGGRSSGIVGAGDVGADAVDGSNISDDAIDSEHYAAGSIDEAHIADNAVTLAKMAGGTDGQIITFDASGNPSAVGPGSDGEVLTSTGAGSPPAFEAASGGDKRNFIIDGDFTKFPEGNITAIANSAYGAALWENFDVGGELVHDVDQLADVPTVGESSHSSTYSMSIDVTTAESAVAAGDFQVIEYKVTGSDFAHLNQQQVTLSFWHKHTKTGVFCGYFMNSAEDRSYVYEYTQSSADTWEQHTETLTLDTSGTWLLTEADIGLRVGFCMYGGSTFQGTADSWEGAKDYCTSNQVAGADSASNFCKFSQVGLYLGSTAPNFISSPISMIHQQVDYYIEYWLADSTNSPFFEAEATSTTLVDGVWQYRSPKRVQPALTVSAAATLIFVDDNDETCTSAGWINTDKEAGLIRMSGVSTVVVGAAGHIAAAGTTDAYMQADARH